MSLNFHERFVKSTGKLLIPGATSNPKLLQPGYNYSRTTGLMPSSMDPLLPPVPKIDSADHFLADGLSFTPDHQILLDRGVPDTKPSGLLFQQDTTFVPSNVFQEPLITPSLRAAMNNVYSDGVPKGFVPDSSKVYATELERIEYEQFVAAVARSNLVGQDPARKDEARQILDDAKIRLVNKAPAVYAKIYPAKLKKSPELEMLEKIAENIGKITAPAQANEAVSAHGAQAAPAKSPVIRRVRREAAEEEKKAGEIRARSPFADEAVKKSAEIRARREAAEKEKEARLPEEQKEKEARKLKLVEMQNFRDQAEKLEPLTFEGLFVKAAEKNNEDRVFIADNPAIDDLIKEIMVTWNLIDSEFPTQIKRLLRASEVNARKTREELLPYLMAAAIKAGIPLQPLK